MAIHFTAKPGAKQSASFENFQDIFANLGIPETSLYEKIAYLLLLRMHHH